MTESWCTLALVYPVLDARFGSGLGHKRARRVMAREEREAIEAVLATLPATILAWSDGAATRDAVRRADRAHLGALGAPRRTGLIGPAAVGIVECRLRIIRLAPTSYLDAFIAL